MSIKATPECEVENPFEQGQIRERIVVAVVKDLADVPYVDLRCIDEQTFFGHFQVGWTLVPRSREAHPTSSTAAIVVSRRCFICQ